jgi:N-acetyl sugar amidotransferase
MDDTAPDIRFDANGVCNFCTDFLAGHSRSRLLHTPQEFERLVAEMKKVGRKGPYDCVLGVSGGVDSSYALHLAVEAGLRPLAVHLDNGWNSELAVANINALVAGLKVDLYTHVIDWPENRDMQLSMFKAGVVDIELLMDNAMLALNYRMASKFGLKHVVAGTNHATEGVRMPSGWNHFKLDARNIRSIHKRFGSLPIRSHPLIGTFSYVYYRHLRGIQWVSILDYVAYDKQAALDLLKARYGYKPYPYKHYESLFTRFYQGYILPRKFGMDKRKVHLSTLVASGQMTREAALADLARPPYDPDQLAADRQLVMKKLGIDESWLEKYLASPARAHAEYPSERGRLDYLLAKRARLRSMFGRT